MNKNELKLFIKNIDDRNNFINYHPRHFLNKKYDKEFYKAREIFSHITLNLQENCILNKHKIIDVSKKHPPCVIALATNLALSTASPHIRILKGLSQEIREATGLKVIYIDTNESKNDKGGLTRKKILEADGLFDETWILDGSLELKWDTVIDIIENCNCVLIITLSGMYESFFAPSIASLKCIKSLLYKTNGNAIPFNRYDKLYGCDSNSNDIRMFSDINIVDGIVKKAYTSDSDRVQIATAMRLMEKKVKQTSPLLKLITTKVTLNKNIEWTLMGLEPDGALGTKLEDIKRIKILPLQALETFSKELFKYDIFYHDPEHTNGGIGTISMAYFLGLVIVVTCKNDVWSVINEDNECHTGDDMDEMLDMEIRKISYLSAENRLDIKLKRANYRRTIFDKRRLEYLQWLKSMLKDLIETQG